MSTEIIVQDGIAYQNLEVNGFSKCITEIKKTFLASVSENRKIIKDVKCIGNQEKTFSISVSAYVIGRMKMCRGEQVVREVERIKNFIEN